MSAKGQSPDAISETKIRCMNGNMRRSTSQNIQVSRSSLLSGRDVRWPRRMMPLLSHVEYTDGTDKQTDGLLIVTLRFPVDEAGVIHAIHYIVLIPWRVAATTHSEDGRVGLQDKCVIRLPTAQIKG